MINLHQRVAILIDADNVNLDYIEQVLKISEYHGQLEVCRAYGDWEKLPLSPNGEKIDLLNIERIQVKRVGKNATDNHILLEAGELLATDFTRDQIDIFIVVTGDGDFASACNLIQERGREVIVIGHLRNTSKSLRKICKVFCLEELTDELRKLKELHPISPSEVRRFLNFLSWAYDSFIDKKYDWVSYTQLEAKLREIVDDYEHKFGKYNLSEWLRNFSPDYEINENTQMIRRVDTNPAITRRHFLIRAYINTKGPDGLASLGQLGKAAHDMDSNNVFDGKKVSAWIKAYPDIFKIRGDYVIHSNHW